MSAGLVYPPYPRFGGPDQRYLPGWYPDLPDEGPYPAAEYSGENNNTSGMLMKPRGRKKREVASSFETGISGYMDPFMGGYPHHPGMYGTQIDHGKTRKARTSFKHHQLRIMKSYFQIYYSIVVSISKIFYCYLHKTHTTKYIFQFQPHSIQYSWLCVSDLIRFPRVLVDVTQVAR